MKPNYKKIFQLFKKYDEIVIARHIGPDPDAVASQMALKQSLLNTFPHKKVYAVGTGVAKFKPYGSLDRIEENKFTNALLVLLDLPNTNRVDGVYDLTCYKEIIKIDHHPVEEIYHKYDWTEEDASSTCQMITELIFNTSLALPPKAAENLFLGIVSDTDRFLFNYTSSKTFELATMLLQNSEIDIQKCYQILYERPLNEIKFKGYIANNLVVTENGFASIMLSKDVFKEYNVDMATASNVVNDFNYIKEIKAWAFAYYDDKSSLFRVNIRSRQPVINGIASRYNGGGHKYASGARIVSEEDVERLFNDLDQACKMVGEVQDEDN